MCAESQIERHKDNVIKGLQQKINTLETDQQRIDLLLEIEELINSYSPPSIDDILPPDNATSKGRPRNTGESDFTQSLNCWTKKRRKKGLGSQTILLQTYLLKSKKMNLWILNRFCQAKEIWKINSLKSKSKKGKEPSKDQHGCDNKEST